MDTSQVLAKAQLACEHAGIKLTEKRARVLSVLLDASIPLSAYEVVDRLGKLYEQSMAPMSVYRMLDFLIDANLVHRLQSENKFVACSHIACDHNHRTPQFLICNQCRKVREITIEKTIVESLASAVEAAGFALRNTQLELPCVCDECKTG